MAHREPPEVDRIGDLLVGPLARAVLPDVVEDGEAVPRGRLDDRVEQRIVGAAAGGELDADRAELRASRDLGERVRGVVGIHHHVASHARRLATLDGEHRVVTHRHVGGRWEIRGRGEAEAAEDGGDVDVDADPLSSAQPRRVARLPILAAAARMQEVRVDVDQRRGSGERDVATRPRSWHGLGPRQRLDPTARLTHAIPRWPSRARRPRHPRSERWRSRRARARRSCTRPA